MGRRKGQVRSTIPTPSGRPRRSLPRPSRPRPDWARSISLAGRSGSRARTGPCSPGSRTSWERPGLRPHTAHRSRPIRPGPAACSTAWAGRGWDGAASRGRGRRGPGPPGAECPGPAWAGPTTGGGRALQLTRTRRHPPRISGAGRVWILNCSLAAFGVLLYLLVIRHLPAPQAPFKIQWVTIAGMYALSEVFVVHLQFRRNAFSFSLSEIPLVLGLFFLRPSALVIAQFVGAAAALTLYRRQSPLKLVFNVLNFSLEAALATVVFDTLGGVAASTQPRAWAAAFLAASASVVLAGVLVPLAVWLAEGTMPLAVVSRAFLLMFVTTMANTSLALIAVTILWRDPWTAWLLVVPVATLFLAYRAYTTEREKHERLEFLHESTRILERSTDIESGLCALLDFARQMFRAEIAEVVLFPTDERDAVLKTTVGPDMRSEAMSEVEPDDLVMRLRGSTTMLFPRPIPDPVLRDQLGERGIRDAMVAPLRGETRTVGVMLVANRLGDVSTFDDQDLRLFETLANHTSMSLENGRLEKTLAQLTDLQAQRARLLDKAVQAAEDERTRLAADLHDGSIQRLSALSYGLERVRLRLVQGDAGAGAEILGSIQQRLGAEIQALRRLMTELRPPILDERGLEAALFDYALDFQERTGVTCTVAAELPARLEPVQETILYRLAQEALANVGKHARASRVTIAVGSSDDSVVVRVRDDGVGFEPELAADGHVRDHFGLAVMRERVEMAGGVWQIHSRPGDGTLIVASLPVGESPAFVTRVEATA